MLLRDSLMEQSFEASNEVLKSSIDRESKDDFHQTLRADSGCDANLINKQVLENALKKISINNGQASVHAAAKIVLVAPKNSANTMNSKAKDIQELGKVPIQRRISELYASNDASDEVQEFLRSREVSDNMSGDFSSSHDSDHVYGGATQGHVSGQVNLKSTTVDGFGRARAISTANNQIRAKKSLKQDELN